VDVDGLLAEVERARALVESGSLALPRPRL
jgi:hypothetical protein